METRGASRSAAPHFLHCLLPRVVLPRPSPPISSLCSHTEHQRLVYPGLPRTLVTPAAALVRSHLSLAVQTSRFGEEALGGLGSPSTGPAQLGCVDMPLLQARSHPARCLPEQIPALRNSLRGLPLRPLCCPLAPTLLPGWLGAKCLAHPPGSLERLPLQSRPGLSRIPAWALTGAPWITLLTEPGSSSSCPLGRHGPQTAPRRTWNIE